MSRTLKPAIALALLLGALTMLSACGGSDDEEVLSSAGDGSSDVQLTVYSGRSQDLVEPLLDDYPGALEVRFGDSAPLAATILEEGENSPADLFFSQDAGALGALGAEGMLAELPKRIRDQVPARFRSETDDWVGVTGRARIIAYGPEVSEADLPDSPLDLTDPEWAGRVGWAPANASFQAYVTALRESEGEDVARQWLEDMVANDVVEFDSNTPIRDAIADGEIDLGLLNHYYVAQAQAEDPEYPVSIGYPPEGLGSLINVAGIGVLESSENKEEAFEFIEFLLSDEAQEFFVTETLEYPLAEGVAPAPSLVPLDEIPHPEIDLSRISDLEGTLELLRETGAL